MSFRQATTAHVVAMLSDCAYTRNPDPAEEREWVARHIAATSGTITG